MSADYLSCGHLAEFGFDDFESIDNSPESVNGTRCSICDDFAPRLPF